MEKNERNSSEQYNNHTPTEASKTYNLNWKDELEKWAYYLGSIGSVSYTGLQFHDGNYKNAIIGGLVTGSIQGVAYLRNKHRL
jgi:hypothetical protein